jgi:hypothetical protein
LPVIKDQQVFRDCRAIRASRVTQVTRVIRVRLVPRASRDLLAMRERLDCRDGKVGRVF